MTASTGNAGTLVLRAFPTGFKPAQKNYMVFSGGSSKYLDVYCDANEADELRVDWYPGGVLTTMATGVTCPTNKWFLVGVAINNEGSDANIEVEVRIQDSATWETIALQTETGKTLQYADTGDILIGSSFIGTIHSVEFLTTNGDLSLSRAALNSNNQIIILNPPLACDGTCQNLCLQNSASFCTECAETKFFTETVASSNVGTCTRIMNSIY